MASPKKPFNGKGKRPAKKTPAKKQNGRKKGLGMGGAIAIVVGGGAVIGGGLAAANHFDSKKRKAEDNKKDAIRRANEKLKSTRRKASDFKFGNKK